MQYHSMACAVFAATDVVVEYGCAPKGERG